MKCPKCQVEMRISSSRNVLENDDTPETPTKLFKVLELTCMNRNCENFDTVVQTVKNELPIG